MRILFTGGGTAGHVTPNLALMRRLLAEGWQVDYAGSKSGVERELVAAVPGVAYPRHLHGASSGAISPGRTLRTRSASCAACARRAA